MKRIAVTLSILLLLVVIPFSVSLFQQRVGYRGRAAGDSALLINQAHSLRFFGHGFGNIDRVEIRIDDPTNNNPGPPADIGATDFTIEFWMKAKASENASDRVGCGQNINWIHGNIVIDRDRFNQDRKFGLSIAGGSIVFGVTGDGTGDRTICGVNNVLDAQWHHIAVQRRRSDGWLWLYVDGILEAEANGPDGDISYPDNGVPGDYCGSNGREPCTKSDPYLIIAAEKHDAGLAYPSYSGWVDELRLSTAIRYTSNFTPFLTPFIPDIDTVALYHFDEGPAGSCTGAVLDSSGAAGGPSDGSCNYGGSNLAGPIYSDENPFSTEQNTPTPINVPTTTPTNTPTPGSGLTGDVNGDGRVDIVDLVLVGANFGGSGPAGDVNKDGVVNVVDLVLVGANFGRSI